MVRPVPQPPHRALARQILAAPSQHHRDLAIFNMTAVRHLGFEVGFDQSPASGTLFSIAVCESWCRYFSPRPRYAQRELFNAADGPFVLPVPVLIMHEAVSADL